MTALPVARRILVCEHATQDTPGQGLCLRLQRGFSVLKWGGADSRGRGHAVGKCGRRALMSLTFLLNDGRVLLAPCAYRNPLTAPWFALYLGGGRQEPPSAANR